jgi:hypothetical protein
VWWMRHLDHAGLKQDLSHTHCLSLRQCASTN